MVSVRSDLMMQAAESGQEGIRKAADRAQQESQFSREQGARLGQSMGDQAQRQEQMDTQARQFESDFGERQRSNRMDEAIKQDAQDVDMADRGLERKGQTRADKVKAEMDRGGQQTQGQQKSPQDQAADARYKAQSEKGLEVAGPDTATISPTEQRLAEKSSSLTTNRLNAQANYLNAMRNMHEAKMSGNPEALKASIKEFNEPIKEAARIYDLGKKRNLDDAQWNNIKAEATGPGGQMVPDPELQKEIETKTFGPAVGRFLQNRVSMASLNMMAATGAMPDGDLVDLASPMMRQFTQNSEQVQSYLRAVDAFSGGMASRILKIDSLAKRNSVVRQMTARSMLTSMAKPMSGGDGGVIPSQGGASAQPRSQRQLDQDPNGPVQRGLVQREQRTVDQQSQKDAGRARSGSAYSGNPSYGQLRTSGL